MILREEDIFVILRKEPLMKNIRQIGFDDLNGKPAFQMAMQKVDDRYYLYTASFAHNGWNIVEVTDPENPRNVKWIEGPWFYDIKDGQATMKIQVADGLMITAHGSQASFLMGCEENCPSWGGIMIWDVKTDPETPKYLGKFECPGGQGVHRSFYSGGRYAYITGCDEGFASFFLRIIDLQDPTNPVEAGHFYVPEQIEKDADDVKFGDHLFYPFVHAVTVKDDIAYLAYSNVGFVMVDVHDKSNPKMISKLPINPVFGGDAGGAPVHTAYPLGDRPFAIVSTEGERSRYFDGIKENGFGKKVEYQAMNTILMVETGVIEHPRVIAVFPYPEVPEGYTHGTNFNFVDGVRVPFGPHNLFDAFGVDVYQKLDQKVLCCYFHAGLRIFDVSDPFVPKEVAYFLPPDPEKMLFDNKEHNLMPGSPIAITEDVLVDDRENIYISTQQDGLYILRYTGEEGLH